MSSNAQDSFDEQINTIKKWYSEVEANVAACRVVKMDDWVDEDEYSGYTPAYTFYLDKETGACIKFVEYGAADWHEITKSYYFHEGELFFVFETGYFPGEMMTAEELEISEEELWEMGGEAKTLRGFENRIYFWKGKTIQFLSKEIESENGVEFNFQAIENQSEDKSLIEAEGYLAHAGKCILALRKKEQ